jgi:hypothetical protein
MEAHEVDPADRSHRKTYNVFTALMKYGTIVSFITAAIVVLIISS